MICSSSYDTFDTQKNVTEMLQHPTHELLQHDKKTDCEDTKCSMTDAASKSKPRSSLRTDESPIVRMTFHPTNRQLMSEKLSQGRVRPAEVPRPQRLIDTGGYNLVLVVLMPIARKGLRGYEGTLTDTLLALCCKQIDDDVQNKQPGVLVHRIVKKRICMFFSAITLSPRQHLPSPECDDHPAAYLVSMRSNSLHRALHRRLGVHDAQSTVSPHRRIHVRAIRRPNRRVSDFVVTNVLPHRCSPRHTQ